jgi:peptidoglycan/LPS O-acetylase OafA/YrhL
MPAPDVPPTPDAPVGSPEQRMASLDGLRGLAALSVFVFHGWLYTQHAPSSANRSTVADYAAHELRLGLVLFFVLSGFLLYRPWVAAVLEGRERPHLGRYVRARAARIAPAYYAALLGSIALLWGLAGTPGLRLPPAEALPLYFVFGQNLRGDTVMKLDPPMWSLVVEVCFYAAVPLLAWLAGRLPARPRAQAIVPLGMVAAGIAFNWAIAGQGLGMTFSKTLPAMAPYFGLGMLAAVWTVRVAARPPAGQTRWAMLLAGTALVAGDALVKAGAAAGAFDPQEAFVIFRDLPSAAGFALVVAALASALRAGGADRLGARALAHMGTVSYGFYLWHVPVLLALRGHGLLPLDPVLGTLVAFGPALAVSALSWFALERPAIRWAARRNGRGRAARRPDAEAARRSAASGRGDGVRRGEVGTVRA